MKIDFPSAMIGWMSAIMLAIIVLAIDGAINPW